MVEFKSKFKAVGDDHSCSRHIEGEILVESAKLEIEDFIRIAENVMGEVGRLKRQECFGAKCVLVDINLEKTGKVVYSIYIDLRTGPESIVQEFLNVYRRKEAEQIHQKFLKSVAKQYGSLAVGDGSFNDAFQILLAKKLLQAKCDFYDYMKNKTMKQIEELN